MTVETIQLILRITARCSGTLFLLGFGGPGWARVPALAGISARRRVLLLGFGFLHTVHVGFVVSLAYVMGLRPFWSEFNYGLIGGGLLILLMWGWMADLAAGPLRVVSTRAWGGITEGLFFAVFALSFTVKSRQVPPLVVLTVLAITALVVRIAAWFAARRQRKSLRATV